MLARLSHQENSIYPKKLSITQPATEAGFLLLKNNEFDKLNIFILFFEQPY